MFIEVLYPETKQALEKIKDIDLVEDFYLAGGTALALELGHRRSVDLDFFQANDFDTEKLLQTLSGISNFSVIIKKPGTLTGNWIKIRLEFFKYPYTLLEPLLDWQGIKLAQVKDIALMKLVAISDRGTKKDFFDLYEICQQTMSLDELFSLLPKKFVNVDYNKYHLLKSLVYFDDAETDPDPDMLKVISWEQVKKFFIDKAKLIEFS